MHKFWVGSLSPAPRHGQDSPIDVCCMRVRGTIAVQRGHERRVHCQLRATEKRQSVGENLQPALVSRIWSSQVEIPKKCVGHDPDTSFSANAGTSTLNCKPPAVPEPPLWHMQRDGGQKHREDGHIDTDVRREGEGGGGASTGGHGRGGTQSSSNSWTVWWKTPHTRQRPTLRSQQSLLLFSKAWHQIDPCVVVQCAMPLRAATRVVCLPGSKASGSRIGGRSPLARASHDGGSNPSTPDKHLAADAAAAKVGGVSGHCILSRMRAATSGFLVLIMARQSAQLAQDCLSEPASH